VDVFANDATLIVKAAKASSSLSARHDASDVGRIAHGATHSSSVESFAVHRQVALAVEVPSHPAKRCARSDRFKHQSHHFDRFVIFGDHQSARPIHRLGKRLSASHTSHQPPRFVQHFAIVAEQQASLLLTSRDGEPFSTDDSVGQCLNVLTLSSWAILLLVATHADVADRWF
jgi:hypothetical protein